MEVSFIEYSTAERIKEALSIRAMKQAELVEKTGISKGALSSYISGSYEPKQRNLYKIAKALEVDVSWLMGNDVPMDPKTSVGGMTNYTLATLINQLRNDGDLQKILTDYQSLNNENKIIVSNLITALKEKE